MGSYLSTARAANGSHQSSAVSTSVPLPPSTPNEPESTSNQPESSSNKSKTPASIRSSKQDLAHRFAESIVLVKNFAPHSLWLPASNYEYIYFKLARLYQKSGHHAISVATIPKDTWYDFCDLVETTMARPMWLDMIKTGVHVEDMASLWYVRIDARDGVKKWRNISNYEQWEAALGDQWISAGGDGGGGTSVAPFEFVFWVGKGVNPPEMNLAQA